MTTSLYLGNCFSGKFLTTCAQMTWWGGKPSIEKVGSSSINYFHLFRLPSSPVVEENQEKTSAHLGGDSPVLPEPSTCHTADYILGALCDSTFKLYCNFPKCPTSNAANSWRPRTLFLISISTRPWFLAQLTQNFRNCLLCFINNSNVSEIHPPS